MTPKMCVYFFNRKRETTLTNQSNNFFWMMSSFKPIFTSYQLCLLKCCSYAVILYNLENPFLVMSNLTNMIDRITLISNSCLVLEGSLGS